jgi:DNA mismatch endonuclease, patch repair protein
MADTFSTEFRSAIMRKVKHKGNKSTEQRLIVFFKENGIKGWRRNYKAIGKPDFVFLDQRIAIFADGCFWHGHDCRNTTPKQNTSYWEKKRLRNKLRDQEINKRFRQRGWKVIRYWECEIKSGNIDLSQLH